MPNSITIAYLGDAVYELYIREYLLSLNLGKIKDIQKESLKFISANSQRKHLENLINNNILSQEEVEYVKIGRNTKGGKSKSTDIITYRIATGLEYLIGRLYLENNHQRIKEIINYITGGE
jgi:ribonuclease-3 family protein